MLTLGSAATGTLSTLVLDGGDNEDTLSSDSASPTTFYGGSGNDNIKGGRGNDVIWGGDGDDILEGRGGIDSVNGEGGKDLIRESVENLFLGETFTGGGQPTTGPGDRIEIIGSSALDAFRVTISGSSLVIGKLNANGLYSSTFTGTGIEEVSLKGSAGNDTYLIDGELEAAGVKLVLIDVGSGADTVTVRLTSSADNVVLGSSAGGSTFLTVSGGVVAGGFSISVSGTSSADDRLIVDAGDGPDFLDASGMQAVVWNRVDLLGGAGNDRIIGTPSADTIDSGLGDDIVSGGGGEDTFVDAGGYDTIIESFASDFGLYGNLLVIGVATTSGTGESKTVSAFTSATAENISMFEKALLSGTFAESRNVFAVGSATGSVLVNGVARTVTGWAGVAELNGRNGSDEYVLELAGMRGATVEVIEQPETGTTTAANDVIWFRGTSARDTGRVLVGPSRYGLATTSFAVGNGSAAASTLIVSGRIEQTGIYLLAGDDRLALRGLNVVTVVDAGQGGDLVLVGSNANENEDSNAGGTLNFILAALQALGATGFDGVSLDDGADTLANSGTLTATTLTGLGLGGTFTYGGFETVTLGLGSGNDSLSIRSSAAGAVTTVRTGNGVDTIDVSSDAPANAGTLDLLAGHLVLDGQAGADVLNLSDAGDTVANLDGRLTSTELTGLGTQGVEYANFATLTLKLGSGADVLAIDSTHAGSTTVSTFAGADRIDVASLSGTVTLNAGDGDDEVTIRSSASGSVLVVNGGLGDDWIDVLALGGAATVNGDAGNDTVELGSAAAATRRVVDTGGNLNAIAGSLTVNGGGSSGDRVFADETGETGAAGNDGTLTSTRLTGLGLGSGVTYGGLGSLTIRLGSAGTRFDIRSTLPVTLLETGGGDDVVNVSSDAPTNAGTLHALAGHLTIDGQGGADTVNLSDAGDTAGDTGQLTSTDLTGLGTAGVTYLRFETLNLVLGSGNDTLTIASTHAGTTTLATGGGSDLVNVRTIAGLTTVDTGAGADTVRVGTTAPTGGGLLDGIAALLQLTGGSASDTLVLDDGGDTTSNTGRLTLDHLSGLGTSSAGIDYFGFEVLTVQLGSGADTFYVDSTHLGSTTVAAGAGADAVLVETVSGPTLILGEGGNDVITVNDLLTSPSTDNGIDAVLTLDGGTGDDRYHVWTFGNDDSRIVVLDGAGNDRLDVYGTAGADRFLFRRDLVALLNDGDTRVERIVYGSGTELLVVHGLLGDDLFALDDNSTVTVVNGDEGDDRFQVGQLWGALTRGAGHEPGRGADRPPHHARRADERCQRRDHDQRRDRQRHVLDLQQRGRRSPSSATTATTRSSSAPSSPRTGTRP